MSARFVSSAHGMPQLPMKSFTISQNLARNTSPGSLCASATLDARRLISSFSRSYMLVDLRCLRGCRGSR
jgi:hypothetical protein